MEALGTAKAAAQLGVNVQKFHRLAGQHGITPVLAAEGLTGAKFWSSDDVDRLGQILEAKTVGA